MEEEKKRETWKKKGNKKNKGRKGRERIRKTR